MPFDPFFSSKNKKCFIPNPQYTELMAKALAMPEDKRRKWINDFFKRPFDQRSLVERQVIRGLRFQYHQRQRALERTEAELYASNIQQAAVKSGTVVLHGGGSIGNSFAQGHKLQKRAFKSKKLRQAAAPHYFPRVNR